MIVVLDTNVIISALLSPGGSPAKVISRWEAEEFSLVISPALLSELERTLNYPKIAKHLRLSEEEIGLFLENIRTFASVVEPEDEFSRIENDPQDNRVLECAVAGHASYIVTGDEHLLQLEEFQGVVILPPAVFLSLLEMNGAAGETTGG